ncbi:glycoside hydrolase family 3 C-terminal domain-containing protein [Streptomyces sp. NBC_01775]|uniref:beta-glucosidase family protein n=1 Tax=Streptomyces sp. NBC_01775 TaxID=2975939 RepID=UPI002DD7B72E|nr:glycoside hydrolase family 3 C-terminal domain-containing protein [Streptomyces sp. NBC_01775]WSB75312.1 glycoside hydrolase family 3 C-terminal domain-containing protein [Streptomyces sp. NBC_01775]
MSDMSDVSGVNPTSGSAPQDGANPVTTPDSGASLGAAPAAGGAGADARARAAAVEDALAKLSLPAKAALLGGTDMWSVGPESGAGFGRLVMSDGPAGVRGEDWTPEDPSVALPSPTALGATWDIALAHEAGLLLAQEARRKGAHVVLAPTVNLHRTPYGGRHFEAYAEDPELTGVVGAALVSGIQQGGVGTTPKHYVGNDSETDRYTVDVRADGRTLREQYLAPFERIVRTARPWGVMAAYNSVNGVTMSEHDTLNNGVLRGEWGFDGVLVSDWTGARSTTGCALGGLDLAMPGPDTVYGEHLVAAVRDGRVPEETVDTLVRRVLLLAARAGVLDGAPPAVPPHALPRPLDGEATVRELAARSCVLLRNERSALPLDLPHGGGEAPGAGTVRRVAVSGLPASAPRFGGGGSAQVFPKSVSTPLAALREALPVGAGLSYEPGPDPRSRLAAATSGDGFALTAVLHGLDDAELARVEQADGSVRWMGSLPGGASFADLGRVELTGEFTPLESGAHRLAVRGVGHFRLEAGERVLYDAELTPESEDPAAAFLNPPQRIFLFDAEAGQTVAVRLVHSVAVQGLGALFGLVSFELGYGAPAVPDEELIQRAVFAAEEADSALVFVGTTDDSESEGVDRDTLALPGRQDELVSRIAAVNARTVVVVNAGAPVLMPWREEVAAVLLSWFPGEAGGDALADVLLGHAEPGGRLPTTWPDTEDDLPVRQVVPDGDGQLPYAEGPYIGYRAWRRAGAEPAYWFGHGLGYTEWDYEALNITPAAPAGSSADPYAPVAEVTVRVRNSGPRAGREVVQLYLGPEGAERKLVAFAVVEAGPGASAEARLSVPLRALQTWDETHEVWQPLPAPHTFTAARSASDFRLTAQLALAP